MDTKSPPKDPRPNFLIIVADDLGFTDCSSFGSEIQTPHIDSLAHEPGGLRFTSFHVAAACSPTRAMLMTGTDHHITGLGQLSEVIRNSPAHQGQPGHEGYLNDRVVTLPELLRDGGYHTMMSGKWHLGLKPAYRPQARGFTRSFALLPGCANHFAYEPAYSRIDEPPRFFETAVTALHMEDAEYVPTSALPADFYSSDYYTTKLLQYFSERDDEEKSKPFFAYLPFSAPHWPLQCPRASMAKYRGLYDSGPEVLRQRRLARLKETSMIPKDTIAHEIVTAPGEPGAWEEMTSREREKSARAMEAYAGMVDRMDWNIGRVLDDLRASGEYDNTYILFMSDNGAEGASYEARDAIREDVLAHIEAYYDNSLANIGNATSFVWYGPHWAQAATAPGRLYKMFSTEGGCRVPLILKPAVTSTAPSSRAGGVITDAFCTVMDILPTLLEYAGLAHPETYKGKAVARVRGRSWRSFLEAEMTPSSIHDVTHATGFEVAGSGALRRGRYKITYVPHPHGPQKWELFDLENDPGERDDLRSQQPEVFREMLGLWEEYKAEVGVVGLAGELEALGKDNGLRDEFEDTGRWIRFLGKTEEEVPGEYRGKF